MDPQLYTQLILVFAGALLGALFGGFARWTGARNDRRLRLTLDLYNEFHSPLFNHVRITAHEALEHAGAMPAAYEAAESERREAIASIVHFSGRRSRSCCGLAHWMSACCVGSSANMHAGGVNCSVTAVTRSRTRNGARLCAMSNGCSRA